MVRHLMKMAIMLSIIGVIIIVSGMVFFLQGLSVVGPESSFMYSNPKWISYGIEIIVVGVIMIGVGFGIKILKRN